MSCNLNDQALMRIASAIIPRAEHFRRGRYAAKKHFEPVLTQPGGNGVDLIVKPPINPNQIYMASRTTNYVVVPDPEGPWVTAGGVTVNVYSIANDGQILWDIPGDFAVDYDEYLETGVEPVGQGAEFMRTLNYFNLDVQDLERWKGESYEIDPESFDDSMGYDQKSARRR